MSRQILALHYRAFKYDDVGLSNYFILIGRNDSGKSSFLDAVNFIKVLKSPQKEIEKRRSRFDELLWNQMGNKFEIAFEPGIPDEIRAKLKDKDFYWHDTKMQPKRPKQALKASLRGKRVPRSSSIYQEIAQKASLEECQDQSFKIFQEIFV